MDKNNEYIEILAISVEYLGKSVLNILDTQKIIIDEMVQMRKQLKDLMQSQDLTKITKINLN